MECKFCKANCQKAGRQKNGAQKLYCKACGKYQQAQYKNQACQPQATALLPALVCESVGIRGIARILKIAGGTVLRRIKSIAAAIEKPAVPLNRASIEIDEVRTFVKHKGNQYWVAYALCSQTKQVLDFNVGKRTKRTLKTVVNTVLLSGAAVIKTDQLNIYRTLIPPKQHIANAYNINYIERHNLNLRTHLKRLGRRTICFNKNAAMLTACLKIYFGRQVSFIWSK